MEKILLFIEKKYKNIILIICFIFFPLKSLYLYCEKREKEENLKNLSNLVFDNEYRKKYGLPLIKKDHIKEDNQKKQARGIDDFVEIHYNKTKGEEIDCYTITDSTYLNIGYSNVYNIRIIDINYAGKYISFVDFFKILKEYNKLSLSNDSLFYNEKIIKRSLKDTSINNREKEILRDLNDPFLLKNK